MKDRNLNNALSCSVFSCYRIYLTVDKKSWDMIFKYNYYVSGAIVYKRCMSYFLSFWCPLRLPWAVCGLCLWQFHLMVLMILITSFCSYARPAQPGPEGVFRDDQLLDISSKAIELDCLQSTP